MEIDGKVFVVTGAGGGVGRELTLALLDQGARVAAVDFREESLAKLREITGPQVETFLIDITDKNAVMSLPQLIINRMGRVDGLINNAGIIQPFIKVNLLTIDDAIHVMSVNFSGSLYMMKAFLPHLLDRPEGHIVNISSMGAYVPVPGQSLYGASKAALAQSTDGLRSELRGTKVRVTLVFPGAMSTDIAKNSGVVMAASSTSTAASKIPTTDPSVAAQMIIEAIQRERERVFIGSDARLMHLLVRISPRLAARVIYRKMQALLDQQ